MTPQELRECASWMHTASLSGIATGGYECARVVALSKKLSGFADEIEKAHNDELTILREENKALKTALERLTATLWKRR